MVTGLLIFLPGLALHFKMRDLSCTNRSVMIKLQLITTNWICVLLSPRHVSLWALIHISICCPFVMIIKCVVLYWVGGRLENYNRAWIPAFALINTITRSLRHRYEKRHSVTSIISGGLVAHWRCDITTGNAFVVWKLCVYFILAAVFPSFFFSSWQNCISSPCTTMRYSFIEVTCI